MGRNPAKNVKVRVTKGGKQKADISLHGNSTAAKLVPDNVELPPVIPEASRHDQEEHDSVRIEILMLKGVRSITTLGTLLGCNDPRRIRRLIARVQARWESYGSMNETRLMRGEALARLDQIENELWITVQNSDDLKVKQMGLRNLLESSKQRMDLQGLTPRRIELLMAQLSIPDNSGAEVINHARLIDTAKRVAGLIEQRLQPERHTIDVEADEPV